MNRFRLVLVWLAGLLLSACSAMTTISATQPGASVTITTSKQTAVPRTESFTTTSFGNFEFRAEAPGFDPFYGVLPLKFNGGHLALDIIFFAPAAFFNLREVFSFYEFDIANKQVKYKRAEAEAWSVHMPPPEETAHAKAAFAAGK